jgi:DNA-binding IscR family transcriptional regulator
MDSAEKVIAAFKKSKVALSAGQVAEATGVDRKEVDKIMAKLKKEGSLESPKACYWMWKAN